MWFGGALVRNRTEGVLNRKYKYKRIIHYDSSEEVDLLRVKFPSLYQIVNKLTQLLIGLLAGKWVLMVQSFLRFVYIGFYILMIQ